MTKRLTLFFILGVLLFSCKGDDNVSCVTCSNAQTLDFTVCNEADGDASVNGQDTGQSYDVYIANLQQQEGTSCN
ncbi:MAG: hypothetical protein ABJM06_11040 [Gilvibacter sp.]